jgi:hypothetical protein
VKYIDEHPYWQNWAYFEALLLEAREVIGEVRQAFEP